MKRRSKAEIDRRYMFGDALIKAGGALMLAVALAAVASPFTLKAADASQSLSYVGVLGSAGFVAAVCAISGRRLRRTAATMDKD